MMTTARLPLATPIRLFRGSETARYSHQSLRTWSSHFAEAPTLRRTSTTPSIKETLTASATSSPPVLSLLTFPILFRSYLISAVSSSPYLLIPSLRFLSLLAHSNSSWLQHNRVLHFILKKTFYKQFCAGETPAEVQRTAAKLKEVGFTGVILAYAKEIVPENGAAVEEGKYDEAKDVEGWKEGTLETVKLADRDGYAALKYEYSYFGDD